MQQQIDGLASKTVFHMRRLVKAVYSGQLSGVVSLLGLSFGACTVETSRINGTVHSRWGLLNSTLIMHRCSV